MNSFDEYGECVCDSARDKVDTKLKDLSMLICVMLDTNPQYSIEIFHYLNKSCDYLSDYNTLLMSWEKSGCLDLHCYDCKYIENKKNNYSSHRNVPCTSDPQHSVDKSIDKLASLFKTLSVIDEEEKKKNPLLKKE